MKHLNFSKLALAVAISGAMVGGNAIAQETGESDYDLQNMKTEQNESNVSGNQGVYSTGSESQATEQRDLTQSTDQDSSSQWNAQESELDQQQSDSYAMDSESKKTIQFEFDSADLTDEGEQKLQELAQSLNDQNKEAVQVKIEGYTDTSGPEEYNQYLAEQRAKAVQDFLASEGIEQAKIEVEARGEENPIASNDSRDGRAQNRRVEVSIEEGAASDTAGAS